MENKYFKGCSGAPIVDDDGNLVSLVVSGQTGMTDIVNGIPLSEMQPVIDSMLEQ
jgi:hypothetical protein